MKSLSVIAVLLLVPALAHAGWNVTPPKGWEPLKLEQADAAAKAVQEKLGANTTVAYRSWNAPGGDGTLTVVHIDMDPARVTMTLTAFVDAVADQTVKSLAGGGFKPASSTAARAEKDGQIVAYRTAKGGLGLVQIVARAMGTDNGHVEVLTVTCFGTASTCKRVVAAATLTKRAVAAK